VAEDQAAAREALRKHLHACGTRTGRVEVVETVVGADLAHCYMPTGEAWRAVLASDGRLMLYPDVPRGLTAREREVAALAASGMPSKQIARTLFISKRTVDTHLRHVYAKTGTGSRVQLANWLRAKLGPVAE
jgi:DNA-binding CsgD family transcriptional regulator